MIGRGLGVLAGLTLGACAAGHVTTGSPPPATPTLDTAGWEASASRRPRARALRAGAVVTVAPARDAGAPRPRGRRARVDASFHRADLSDALRMLADAGGLDVVVAEGVRGVVTLALRDVDPYDAIVAVASAHGARVSVRGRVVVVR